MYLHDAHVHMNGMPTEPGEVLRSLDAAGVNGASIISPPPQAAIEKGGMPYSQRMDCLMRLANQDRSRLYPILWIHPYEENAVEIVKDAAKKGVAGFKMICDSYYVYDPRSMELIRAIAELDRPLMFHSGILWDGGVSSRYNRPLDWEAMIEIPHLRFSLAHCAWPWIDECIALYGKFLNAYTQNPECSAEMFLDMTPGTPAYYRSELIEKLFGVGYDVKNNLLFGTDCIAEEYRAAWTREWLQRDEAIYDQIHLPEADRALVYGENARRFLSLSSRKVVHAAPMQDGR